MGKLKRRHTDTIGTMHFRGPGMFNSTLLVYVGITQLKGLVLFTTQVDNQWIAARLHLEANIFMSAQHEDWHYTKRASTIGTVVQCKEEGTFKAPLLVIAGATGTWTQRNMGG